VTKPYWEAVPLAQMTREQWEGLCDGCGKCCLLKLEDEDDGALTYTNIACRLFDDTTCRCMNYQIRRMLVKGCVVLTPETLPEASPWPIGHPLISGSRETVHEAGISMRDATVPEYEVAEEDWYDYAMEGEV